MLSWNKNENKFSFDLWNESFVSNLKQNLDGETKIVNFYDDEKWKAKNIKKIS